MSNKFTNKLKNGAKTVVTGQDGSILDVVRRIVLFIKEFIIAINEKVQMRRNEKMNNERDKGY